MDFDCAHVLIRSHWVQVLWSSDDTAAVVEIVVIVVIVVELVVVGVAMTVSIPSVEAMGRRGRATVALLLASSLMKPFLSVLPLLGPGRPILSALLHFLPTKVPKAHDEHDDQSS